jgi:hypothetical protein
MKKGEARKCHPANERLEYGWSFSEPACQYSQDTLVGIIDCRLRQRADERA